MFQGFKSMKSKTLYSLLIVSLTLVLSTSLYRASAEYKITAVCKQFDITGASHPSPLHILCPIPKIVNILTLMSGVVFVGLIITQAVRYAFSANDPKQLAAVHSSSYYIALGFGVVLGALSFLAALGNVLGIDSKFLSLDGALDQARIAICSGFKCGADSPIVNLDDIVPGSCDDVVCPIH